MAEGIITETPKINRRSAIKATVVALGAAIIASREIQAGQNGIKTSVGIFYPLYEIHTEPLDPKNIPNNLNAFFKEGMMSKEYYEADPAILLSIIRDGQLFEKLAHNNIKLILGDTRLFNDRLGVDDQVDLNLKEISVAALAGFGGYLYNHIKKMIDEAKGITPSKKELSRRKLIRNASYGVVTYGALPQTNTLLALSHLDFNQVDAAKRILIRANGMTTHLHPENNLLFFRNLLMADKILTVAESLKEQTNTKAKIGFNLGAAHAGIEDFLIAGPNFCRSLISLYPTDFLKQIVEINGSVENLSTARVISMPTNLKSSDLVEGKEAKDIGVSEQRVVDRKLVDLLIPKLAKVA